MVTFIKVVAKGPHYAYELICPLEKIILKEPDPFKNQITHTLQILGSKEIHKISPIEFERIKNILMYV